MTKPKRYHHEVRVPFVGYYLAIIESDSPTLTPQEIVEAAPGGRLTMTSESGCTELGEWESVAAVVGGNVSYAPLNEACIDETTDRQAD